MDYIHLQNGYNVYEDSLYYTGDKRRLWTSSISRIKPETLVLLALD